MPNSRTFLIKPIRKLLNKYIKPNQIWIDPFANENSPATHRNDINPDVHNVTHHLDFRDFLRLYNKAYGIILDCPYSVRQIKECYDNWGLKMSQKDSQGGFYPQTWDEVLRILPEYIIQFGWHTNGREKHYEIIEILIVAHGGAHNDTICSVWKKRQSMEEFF